MTRRPRLSARATAPVRAALQRFGFVALLGLAATLMAMDRADLGAARTLRAVLVDAAAPVLDALSRPVESANAAIAEIDALMSLRAENAELREANARLRGWEGAARALEQENAALRRAARLAAERLPVFVTGRVVGDSGNAFVRTLLVAAGARDGVAKGQAAIASDGVVGRVVDVGRRASRVLLITDINSRVPVRLERSRQRAILAGDNGALARLDYLPNGAAPAVGERVVTSGHGGLLPPGLPVGVVARAEANDVRVRPLAEFGRIDYVRLVAWTPPALGPAPPAGGGYGAF